MPVGALKGWGVRCIHADVTFVVGVEVAANTDDVRGAARVKREVETNVGDEVIEALLAVEGDPGQWEGQGSRVLNMQGERPCENTFRNAVERMNAGKVESTWSLRRLSPAEVAKAWSLRVKEKRRWSEIANEVVSVHDERPSEWAIVPHTRRSTA